MGHPYHRFGALAQRMIERIGVYITPGRTTNNLSTGTGRAIKCSSII
jgi:hypothetical protein